MSPRRNNFAPITSQPEVKSSPKSCCGSRKMVKDKPDISPDVNSQTEMDGPEDQVVQVQEIDIAAAEAAIERAKAAMKEDHSVDEVAAIQASLQKALAQLRVKRRRHS